MEIIMVMLILLIAVCVILVFHWMILKVFQMIMLYLTLRNTLIL